MKTLSYSLLLSLLFTACLTPVEDEMPAEEQWTERIASISAKDSLFHGKTYLSVYSHIYSVTEHRLVDLSATIGLRNTSTSEVIYITTADYYHTDGELVKSYLEQPIYINPMETAEIMIFEKDQRGGTGGNFIFEWATASGQTKPYFEAVMISTHGRHGLSFTTQGIEL